jgi:hypothetical protein
MALCEKNGIIYKNNEKYMEKQPDFYKNDADNVVSYWQKREGQGVNDLRTTAKTLAMIFNNVEGRINRDKALKEMGKELISAGQDYKSINVFENDMKPLFEELDNNTNGSKIKTFLTNFKKAVSLTSFKKHGLADVKALENNSLSTLQINSIVNATVILKENIEKDVDATAILENMKKSPAFKKEFDLVHQREADLKEFKENTVDNHFVEWMKDMGKFYGVKDITKIPEGNDRLSIEYREKVLPEMDKMLALVDRLTLSDNKNNNTFSLSLTDQEHRKLADLKDQLHDYRDNKKNFTPDVVNTPKVSVVTEVPFESTVTKKANDIVSYKAELKYVEAMYEGLTQHVPGYPISRQIMDMVQFKSSIDQLPNNVSDSTDALKIANFKDKIANNDFILLDEFNTAKQSFDKLQNNGNLKDVKNNFKDLNEKLDKTYIERDLKTISDLVTKIEKKHGLSGVPLFSETDKITFSDLKVVADSYKKHQQQTVKNDTKLSV